MYNWKKDIASWKIDKVLYLSVVFTWHLPRAKEIAREHRGKVIVGGPAVSLMPDYLGDVAEVEHSTIFPALSFHNPLATFTTRGCPNRCSFCAVPKTEGDLVELKQWEIKPHVCDNNLFASSRKHFDKVIDSFKQLPFVDFGAGTDVTLFSTHHADRLAELRKVKLRFAFDHISKEASVVDGIKLAKRKGLKNISCYVLIGFNDTPEDAIYRLELLRSLGVMPNPMRFQPLYALQKNEHVDSAWTELGLQRVMRYYSNLRYLDHVPFTDYKPEDSEKTKQIGLLA